MLNVFNNSSTYCPFNDFHVDFPIISGHNCKYVCWFGWFWTWWCAFVWGTSMQTLIFVHKLETKWKHHRVPHNVDGSINSQHLLLSIYKTTDHFIYFLPLSPEPFLDQRLWREAWDHWKQTLSPTHVQNASRLQQGQKTQKAKTVYCFEQESKFTLPLL